MSIKKASKIGSFSAVGIICFIFFQSEVFAMSFFGLKLCVFSAVQGTVVKDGQPIANALIKQTYKWNGDSFTDEVNTDKNGHFEFTEKYHKSIFAIFPHNPSVSQRIKIYVNNNEYLAWAYAKDNYDPNGELNGKAMNMHCDLDNPQEKHQLDNYKMYTGICELR